MFNLLESVSHTFDVRMAAILASQGMDIDTDFGDYVTLLIQKYKIQQELEQLHQQQKDLEDQINWAVIQNDDITQHISSLDIIKEEIERKQSEIEDISSNKIDIENGPCVLSLDATLKELGVERQAYHGKSFIGNHCHKMLRVSESFFL